VCQAFSASHEQLNRLAVDDPPTAEPEAEVPDPVLQRVVGRPWPFPRHDPLAPQRIKQIRTQIDESTSE